jgi:SAM-dependent methyltransferase
MYRETTQSERLYTEVAGRYDAVFERAILAEGRLTQLTRKIMNGRRIIDLACGNGRWLDRIRPSSYVGIDPNEAMLEQARLRHPQAQFIRGDMTVLPFADGSFDGAMSMFGAMGHLPEKGQRAMIREIHRVLNPGGVAILTNGNMWSPFALPVTLTGNHVRLEGVRFKVYSATPHRFIDLLRGLNVMRLESYDHSFIPILPIKFISSLLGRDYRNDYTRLMDIYGHSSLIPSLRWFGKQLLAVCQKGCMDDGQESTLRSRRVAR